MNYALAVYGAMGSSQAGQTALSFAKAVLASGHTVSRIFFYQDGVQNASSLSNPPQDEVNLPAEWQELVQQNEIDAVVCIAAALRRGVVDADEAERYQLPASNLADGFQLSGLGQLLESLVETDRLITFGA
ncbi:sulfurtransferase complex subunit TusD [Endozoicomonas sp. OPT23]|uniref:sulfurtransferase complex subunit TusD n=1 Tax=Endozoicomonas sp. OPT23 TaxID=2072845 RepID=UPI00129AFE5F|nr:sulfurtransferase complex subunit TusD [Endozoicomonas sp. OPT23]MRI34455.1 sulfurtransferase complex subunit TusD [Endozoicomonas sp. OPT23]